MRNKIKVLDHGFVKLLNIAGPNTEVSDRDIARAARISFDNFNEERTEQQDLGLVKYLWENNHSTPFEMIEIWLEMKLPIFIARQFVRHRTTSISEVSGRYITLPEEYYIPDQVGGKPTNGAKQGRSNNLNKDAQDSFRKRLKQQCESSYEQYLITKAEGVAPEQARLLLHTNHYTHWIWKQDLRNLIHFLKLRIDSHAQYEAQCYAQAIVSLLQEHLPNIIEITGLNNGRSSKSS